MKILKLFYAYLMIFLVNKEFFTGKSSTDRQTDLIQNTAENEKIPAPEI